MTADMPTAAELREQSNILVQLLTGHPDPADAVWRAAVGELGRILAQSREIDPAASAAERDLGGLLDLIDED